MARGIGMRVDETGEGLKSGGLGQGLVRSFSTDLPSISYGAQIQAGRSLQEVGEEWFAQTQIADAERSAKEAKVGIDEEGNYVRPETPLMGYGVRQHYDRIVDEQFTQTVYRDYEARANEIAAKHFMDPDSAGPLLKELQSSFTAKIREPHLQNALGTIFARESNERLRSIMATRERENWRNTVQLSTVAEQDNIDKGITALQLGEEDRAKEHFDLALRNAEHRVAIGADDPGMLQLAREKIEMARGQAVVLNIFERLAKDEKLSKQDFDYVQTMLRGGGSDETEWNGITKRAILDQFPNKKVRDLLAVQLRQIEGDYFSGLASKRAMQDPVDFEQFFIDHPRANPQHWSDTEFGERTAAWLKSKGLTPEDPRAVQLTYQVTGRLPKGLYGPLFENAAGQGEERMRRLALAWNAMKALQDPDGDRVPMAAGVVADRDAAFMETYSRIYHETAGSDQDRAKTALQQSRALFEKGEQTLKDTRSHTDYLARERTQVEGRSYAGSDIRAEIGKELPGASSDQLERVVTAAAGFMARTGVPYAEARDYALNRFRTTHTQDDLVVGPDGRPGGWVPATLAGRGIPDARGTGQTTTEYRKPYIQGLLEMNYDGSTAMEDKVLGQRREAQVDALGNVVAGAEDVAVTDRALKDPLIPRVQMGKAIAEPLVAGRNVFLMPLEKSSTDPVYQLIYRTPDGVPIELRDKTFQPVTVRFGKVQEYQGRAAAEALKTGDFSAGRRLAQGWDQTVTAAPDPLYTAVPGRVNPFDILVRGADAPSEGGPDFTPDGAAGGRSRGRGPLPPRRDGLKNPLSNVRAMFDPDVAQGENRSLPGEGEGFVIPGTDELGTFTLANFRGHGGVRFEALNGDGPRAGKVVGLNPELATGMSQMIAAMPAEIRQGLTINSAVRSYEQQLGIARDTIRKRGADWTRWAARPGHSRHETGQAMDLGFADERTRRWVHQNAERFGLHFPMRHEPWHIEPVGARRPRRDQTAMADSEWPDEG